MDVLYYQLIVCDHFAIQAPQRTMTNEFSVNVCFQAPQSVQKAAGCIIGQDYPKPIVDHDKVRQINIDRMKKAYAKSSESGNGLLTLNLLMQ